MSWSWSRERGRGRRRFATAVFVATVGVGLIFFGCGEGNLSTLGDDGGVEDAGVGGGDGGQDAGALDAGASDGGASDGGASDGGVFDGGAFDGGPADGGASDAGLADSGVDAGSDAGSGETLVWSEEFNGSALDTSKWQVITGTEGNSQSHYTTLDVSVGNGFLDLRTRRHCVASASDALTDANASTAACAGGLLTEYSSGKVQTDHVLSSGRIEVRAKLPATALGLWPAIWLRNPPGWGSADYGELDTMEWYADDETRDTATSHITCPTANSTVHVQHFLKKTVDLSTDWHVWSMAWSAAGVTYTFDGETLPSNSGDADKSTDTWADFPGVSQATFEGVMNQLWQIRLNTQVTKPGDAWHAAPDDTQPFAPVHFLIDSLRVYQ